MISQRVGTDVYLAQEFMNSSVADFSAVVFTQSEVRLAGTYPKGAEENRVTEVVQFADIEKSGNGANLVREAAQRIEQRVLEPQLRQVHSWSVD